MYRSQNILVEKIIEGIQEKKGYDIAVVNLENIEETICNYFIICQGNSPSHVSAITESVAKFAREQAGAKPSAVDGLRNAQWVAMDYTDVIVHIFTPDAHEFYDLENLWTDADITKIEDIQ